MDFDPSGPAAADAGLFGLDATYDEAQLVVVPVPVDATTSYRQGSAGGPEAVLRASHQLDLFDVVYGRPYEAGIVMLPIEQARVDGNAAAQHDAALARAGGPGAAQARARVDAWGEAVNAYVEQHCTEALERGKIVGILGGDHSAPFAAIAAHLRRYPNLSVLHVDAHADLRVAYEGFTWSHASIMDNVLERTPLQRLVQVGLRDLCAEEHARIESSAGRVHATYEHELATHEVAGRPFVELAGRIVDALSDEVYVSFDIDGLDPRYCPNTGTPVPGGLSYRQALALLDAVHRSGRRVVGFDLCEVSPGPDANVATDSWDANVGARLLYRLSALALTSRDRKSARPRSIGF